MLALCCVMSGKRLTDHRERSNFGAPSERIFDASIVLTSTIRLVVLVFLHVVTQFQHSYYAVRSCRDDENAILHVRSNWNARSLK